MCKIICNVAYSCGHIEPWVNPRTCQYDALGDRKLAEKNPLCLIYRHCRFFGDVRQINISDDMLCSNCFITETKGRKDLPAKAKENMIFAARKDTAFHSQAAQKNIAEADKSSQLKDLSISYINKVTDIALTRLDLAFSDAQMEPHHFDELLQIMMGLPFLDKDRLVGKFANKVEARFGAEDVRHFYKLSMKGRNFGDYFRDGLKDPSVLDH
ncbi:hypothetical protein GQX73_g3726 [Xylaria multiplex]|uniref:Uncharacterized protein n=1 Tax=Xylaria multiplex TaxID=323545 RepID=A0A7C8IZ50_9PEZI|nr:hypothetical protein GQX73_g3726 [Xylaria multiplex]